MSAHFSGMAGDGSPEAPTIDFPLSFLEIFEVGTYGGDMLLGLQKEKREYERIYTRNRRGQRFRKNGKNSKNIKEERRRLSASHNSKSLT
jgi:hypothetical protein